VGQIKPFNGKSDRSLPSAEQHAVASLRWISDNLGKKNKLVPYLAAMLIEEIMDGPVIEGKAESQLAVADALAALSDTSS